MISWCYIMSEELLYDIISFPETIKKKCCPCIHIVFLNYFSNRLFSACCNVLTKSGIFNIYSAYCNQFQSSKYVRCNSFFHICLKSNVHLRHYNLSEGPIRKFWRYQGYSESVNRRTNNTMIKQKGLQKRSAKHYT